MAATISLKTFCCFFPYLFHEKVGLLGLLADKSGVLSLPKGGIPDFHGLLSDLAISGYRCGVKGTAVDG